MDALVLIERKAFEAKAGAQPKLGEVYWFDRPAGLPASFDHVYMVTVRPDHALWLVQYVGTNTWTVDLTPVLGALNVTAAIARDQLATALRKPRALSERDARLLSHAWSLGITKRKPFALKFPAWLIEEAEAADEPAPAEPARPRPPRPKRKRTKLSLTILDGALTQIEGVHDEVRARPARFLATPKPGKRGRFTADVQSLFAGVLPVAKARAELAPFATAKACAAAKTEDAIDELAVRAIDELCRALVATALDRPKDVPRAMKAIVATLPDDVAYVRALLAATA